MRYAHLLRRNKNTELPSQLIFVDTETDSVKINDVTVEAVLRFGWACYLRRHHGQTWSKPQWFRFTTPNEFWAWVRGLNREHTRIYIFSHNQSFDYTVLKGFSLLPNYGYKLKTAVIEGPPTVITYKDGHRSIVLLDTLNYFRCSAKKLGEDIGLSKLRMPKLEQSIYRWDAYCRRDVKVIMSAMLQYIKFISDNNLGSFKPTLASQALSCYKHKFIQSEIYFDDHVDALSMARSSYHGGRVECGRLGLIMGPLYYLDINSMYPFVMRGNPMPTRLLNYTTRATVEELSEWIQHKHAIADVTVNTNSPIYPIYHNSRLIFPIGEFRCQLTTPELQYALEHKHVCVVHTVALYRKDMIFSDFVDYFYNERQKFHSHGNKAYVLLCKILLNSLYGKFGQSGLVYKEEGTADTLAIKSWAEFDDVTNTWLAKRQFGGIIQSLSKEGEARESHPAIAAHVTAYARMYLWQLMGTAGYGNIYYLDTDSLLVNSLGYARLQHCIDPVRLGSLKLLDMYNAVEIRGAKDYTLGDKVVIKGVREKAIAISANVFEQDKFSNFKGMLLAGNLDHMYITRITKHLTRNYTKGSVGEHGLITPLVLGLGSGTTGQPHTPNRFTRTK